jgi:hypothetical protein
MSDMPATAAKPSVLSALLGDRRFIIATVLMAVTAAGWDMTMRGLKWAMYKDPVPWPAAVEVTSDFRLKSLPATLGPYRILEGEKGDAVLNEDLLEQLKIGTALDKSRVAQRQSNWYSVRYYVLANVKSHTPYGAWRLEIYYYTGGLDKVPHVPERCLAAGGATVTGSDNVNVEIAGIPAPWNKFDIERTRFDATEQGLTRQQVVYYLFSLNGQPENSWENVRATLSLPWVRHCYFAKMQFAPLVDNVSDLEEADQAAREFLRTVLPAVLQQLPTAADVQKLSTPTATETKS